MSSQANPKISPPGGVDAELVARAVAGDREAFAALYNAHRDEVLRYLTRRTGNRHLAEDLTQDVFLRALRRIDTFIPRNASSFVAWLMVIARNIHLDHMKLHRVQKEVPVDQVNDESTDPSAEQSAMRGLDAVEAAATVTAVLAVLTPQQLECVRLRFFDELSGPETAARMGKGLPAVKTLQFRALRLMRSALTTETAVAA
ncbi:sigma-70 family RNA polymerase sigma factor [Streptomyces sp. b94]|uniref:RNA polymerase sigma factor n=1 Tax=Streptomyces sp. b94 TaxID=1827634 RepID=UPI001B39093C|nr:RNA polymerase sigma factor [Streptomyces sp. b94]MBQ1096291.1 sigma-70 family RNA polymerase sigma factor [Streptomyces sp. b94]